MKKIKAVLLLSTILGFMAGDRACLAQDVDQAEQECGGWFGELSDMHTVPLGDSPSREAERCEADDCNFRNPWSEGFLQARLATSGRQADRSARQAGKSLGGDAAPSWAERFAERRRLAAQTDLQPDEAADLPQLFGQALHVAGGGAAALAVEGHGFITPVHSPRRGNSPVRGSPLKVTPIRRQRDQDPVIYRKLSADEKAQAVVFLQDGFLTTLGSGRLEGGELMYFLSGAGTLYVIHSDYDWEKSQVYHSSFTDYDNLDDPENQCKMAGELFVHLLADGVSSEVKINQNSGHYKPHFKRNYLVADMLRALGFKGLLKVLNETSEMPGCQLVRLAA